jgi:CheY-like chemotaxis protein
VTKILLIEPDPDRAAALAGALGGGGAEVRIAPDGFYALTLMERERPDLVVAGAWLGGIGVGELGAIVRSDPSLAGVRLALYADPAAPPADLNGGGVFDLVLDAAASAPELAASLRSLAGMPAARPEATATATPVAPPAATPAAPHATARLDPAAPLAAAAAPDRRELPWLAGTRPASRPSGFATAELRAPGAPEEAAGAAPPEPRAESQTDPPAAPARPTDLSGSLGVLDLMELSQAFSLAGKTGQLFLDCPRGEGCIYFELGKVIHATIRDRAGREAFSEILQATLRERNIAFRFTAREPGELGALPRSIDLTVQHLLLSFAVDFDETQEA